MGKCSGSHTFHKYHCKIFEFQAQIKTVVQWLVLVFHSKKVTGLIPGPNGVFLWSVHVLLVFTKTCSISWDIDKWDFLGYLKVEKPQNKSGQNLTLLASCILVVLVSSQTHENQSCATAAELWFGSNG